MIIITFDDNTSNIKPTDNTTSVCAVCRCTELSKPNYFRFVCLNKNCSRYTYTQHR